MNAELIQTGTITGSVVIGTIYKGDKGDKGDAATIKIGTVSTGDPGTDASVTNSGTVNDAVFNFTIPRGDNSTVTFSIIDGDLHLFKSDAVKDLNYYISDDGCLYMTMEG